MKVKIILGIFLVMGILSATVSPAPVALFGPTGRTVGSGPGQDLCMAAEGGPEIVEHYTGYLFYRTERTGSKSEGPEYYLQTFDGREIHVVKKANLWEEDPQLQKMIDRKVWIGGSLVDGELYYTEIKRLYG